MTDNEKAKLILLRDCSVCSNYIKSNDIEFCLIRKWSGMTGFAVANFGKKYGVPALPIYEERTCSKWEIN